MSQKPAGWYADPELAETRRYWDGEGWTDRIAPAGAPDETRNDQAGLIAAGWIALFVLPIAGIIIGLVLANKRPGLGLTIAGLSLVAGIVWLVILSGP